MKKLKLSDGLSTFCNPDGNVVPLCPEKNSRGVMCGGLMFDDSRIGGIKCTACGFELSEGEFEI